MILDGELDHINEQDFYMKGGIDEVIGKSTIELGVWKNLSDREKMVEAVKKDGRVRNLEAMGQSKSGNTFIGDVSSEIIDINEESSFVHINISIL